MLKFINEGRDGLIVLSLGTTVTPESIPREALIAVGKALAVMPSYRVVASLDPSLCTELGMPSNVMCAKRIPQSELLANPSTKVCNLLSYFNLQLFEPSHDTYSLAWV